MVDGTQIALKIRTKNHTEHHNNNNSIWLLQTLVLHSHVMLKKLSKRASIHLHYSLRYARIQIQLPNIVSSRFHLQSNSKVLYHSIDSVFVNAMYLFRFMFVQSFFLIIK